MTQTSKQENEIICFVCMQDDSQPTAKCSESMLLLYIISHCSSLCLEWASLDKTRTWNCLVLQHWPLSISVRRPLFSLLARKPHKPLDLHVSRHGAIIVYSWAIGQGAWVRIVWDWSGISKDLLCTWSRIQATRVAELYTSTSVVFMSLSSVVSTSKYRSNFVTGTIQPM